MGVVTKVTALIFCSNGIKMLSVIAVTFFVCLGQSTVNLTCVYYLSRTLCCNALMVGIGTTIQLASYMFSCIFLEKLTESLRPYCTVFLGILGMLVSTLCMIVVKNVALFYFLLFIYGLSMGIVWPALYAWITRNKEGQGLTKSISFYCLSWSFAVGIYSYIATYLNSKSSISGFVFSAIIFLVDLIIIALAVVFSPSTRLMESEKQHIHELETVQKDHSSYLRYFSWINLFLGYSMLSIMINIFPLYASSILHLPDTTVGIILLARGMTSFLFFYLLGRTNFWYFKRRYLFISLILLSICFGIISQNTSVVCLILIMILFGATFAFVYTYSSFHGSAGALNRNRSSAIFEAVAAIGQILITTLGSVIYEQKGFVFLLASMGLVTILVLVCELIAIKIIATKNIPVTG